MTAERAVMLTKFSELSKKKVTYFGEFCHLNSSCIRKSIILMFWAPREINSRFCSKTHWQMFLLVFGRHVGAHSDGLQHGVSIQISINLGETFLCIYCLRKIALIRIWRESWYLLSFFSRISFKRSWFIFDLFWPAWHWKPAISPGQLIYSKVIY